MNDHLPLLNRGIRVVTAKMLSTVLLSLFLCTSSWAQPGGNLDLNLRNATLVEAVGRILEGTQYRVVYQIDDTATRTRVDLALNDVPVLDALDRLLAPHGITYTLRGDNTIVIQRQERQTPPPAPNMAEGQVVGTDNRPLVGVTVVVAGTTRGTVTDVNGRFSIAASAGDILEFSYIGMQTQMGVVPSDYGSMLIRMNVSSTDIGQVVVTGYSTTSKIRTPGSVEVITAEELQDAPLQSMDMLLQGKVAGMSVQSVSGRPGERAKVRIRGTNTLTGNAEPLWVVNGVPLENNIPTLTTSQIDAGDFSTLYMDGIAGVNPEDIASITVLKDASAAAIYGARAASGVIVVTTKRGQEGPMRVSYSGSVSLTTRPIRTAELMNSAEKLKFEQELWDEFSAERFLHNQDPANIANQLHVPYIGITGMVRGGYGKYAGWTTAQQDEYLTSLAGHTTDWFGELFRHSVSTKHHLSLSGGGERSNYYISLGYDKQNGLLRNNDTDSFSVSSTVGVKASDKINIDFLTSLSYQNAKEPSQGVDVFRYAFFANPYERPYNEDGSYRADETYQSFQQVNGVNNVSYPDNGFNLLRELNETKSTVKNFSASETIQLTWGLLDDLSFSGQASISYSNHNSENVNGANTYTAFTDRPFEGNDITSQRKYGSITQASSYNLGWMLRGQFNYSKTFGGKHYLTALGGAEISSSMMKMITTKRYGYDPVTGGSVSPIPPMSNDPASDIDNLTRIMDGLSGQSIDEQAMASFYFDADYTYDDRYTLKFSLRTDGSNNFGQDKQFNPIWSAGFAWNLMEESFASSFDNVFSRLIFRTSLGYTGNINRSVYPRLVIRYGTDYRYVDNEYLRIGSIDGAPNPNLGWEKTFDYKFNLDMGFLLDRLNVSLEYYNKRSSRVISNVAITSSTGFNLYGYNTSTIANNGFELSLSGVVLKGADYGMSVYANGSYNMNELKKYDAPSPGYGGIYVGYPIDGLFSGDYLGISPYSGMYEYKPRSDAQLGTDYDYTLSKNYTYYLGPRTSPFNGGFGVSGSYKNFTASLSGSFAVGSKVVNDLSAPFNYGSLSQGITGTTPQTHRNDLYTMHYNVLKDQYRRWTSDNPITDGYPRIVDAYDGVKVDGKSYLSNSSITSAALLEDVSYMKFSSISLSYKLGAKMLNQLNLRSAELSFLMNNLFTISTYSGIDPESPGAIYPQSKSFSLALRIGF